MGMRSPAFGYETLRIKQLTQEDSRLLLELKGEMPGRCDSAEKQLLHIRLKEAKNATALRETVNDVVCGVDDVGIVHIIVRVFPHL